MRATSAHVLFIENDVVVQAGWLDALLRCADETRADVVAPLTCEGRPLHTVIHYVGTADTNQATFGADGTGLRDYHEAFHLQGCERTAVADQLRRRRTLACEMHCFMVRRAFLEQIGYFDPMIVSKEYLDFSWGAEHAGRFLWVLLNSGSCGAYAFNHDPDSLSGAHSYRQPALYFPTPGGTLAGESLPGKMTWARAYIRGGELWMDIGRGEVAKLPPSVRDQWWEGTTRQWPFMAADMGISRDTLMAHYLSNHVAVAYGDIFDEMVALSQELGFKVRILGKAA